MPLKQDRGIKVQITDEQREALKQIVVSQNYPSIASVIRDAIERYLVTIGQLNFEVENMEDLVEKLRIQKEEYLSDWRNDGIACGIETAKDLDYASFIELELNESIIPKTDLWYWVEEFIIDPLKEQSETELDADYIEAYKEGWVLGVLKVWEVVKEQI